MGKYLTVGIVMLWLCVARGCPATCKGRTCEDWFKKDGYTCVQLELQYGCDCKGCTGCNNQTCLATCFGKSCDTVTSQFVTTCKHLEDKYNCNCDGCKCWHMHEDEKPKSQCKGKCLKDQYKGDGYCDDENNVCGCGWDGGDCCGKDNKYTVCTNCKCLDPGKAKAGCQGHCAKPAWVNDKICDDSNNICGCNWGGGDCCSANGRKNSYKFCKECRCLERDQQGKPKFVKGCNANCKIAAYKGDNQCDDDNNNCGCGWDGGDCCGSSAGVSYCTKCKCLDPKFDGTQCSGKCLKKEWKGDKVCDDGNNNCACHWDGGDCCGAGKSYNYCDKCSCADTWYKPKPEDSAPGGCKKYTKTARHCRSYAWRGDGFCDARNNICGCNWDGGDCCGSGFSPKYCDAKDKNCKCLDPSFKAKKAPTESSCAKSPKSNCKYPKFQKDGNCDDLNNVCKCNWDGGDCCGKDNNYAFCESCKCEDPALKSKGCQGGCAFKQYKGDAHCDDKNNVCGCDWDGGDCCTVPDGKVRGFAYCKDCLCRDPEIMKNKKCPGNCHSPTHKGDGYCDDSNNNCGCDWDGGDCCGSKVNTKYCKDCLCRDESKTGPTCYRVFKANSACSLKNILGTPVVWKSDFLCAKKCSGTTDCAYFDDRKSRCRLFTSKCSSLNGRLDAKKSGDGKVYKMEACAK